MVDKDDLVECEISGAVLLKNNAFRGRDILVIEKGDWSVRGIGNSRTEVYRPAYYSKNLTKVIITYATEEKCI